MIAYEVQNHYSDGDGPDRWHKPSWVAEREVAGMVFQEVLRYPGPSHIRSLDLPGLRGFLAIRAVRLHLVGAAS